MTNQAPVTFRRQARTSERRHTMTKIGIILGSTRPGRNGEAVARWVLRHRQAAHRRGVRARRPARLQAAAPRRGDARRRWASTPSRTPRQWAAKIASFDGFVFVTPEYNHSTSGALKNAIDFLFAEWNNKAVGFVSYGSVGGTRAVEHLRLIAGELQMADVRTQVALSLFTDFENFSVFKPASSTRTRSPPRSTRSSPGARRSRRCARAEPFARPETVAGDPATVSGYSGLLGVGEQVQRELPQPGRRHRIGRVLGDAS